MTTGLIVLGVLAIIVVNALLLWFFLPRKREGGGEGTAFQLLSQQMNELTRTVDEKIGESTKVFNDSLRHQSGESVRIIRDITERLTEVREGNKQVMNIADQLKSLQDILKNPKQRGILGEYYLETLLKNVLAPNQYQMQYAFENGEIVDAVVFVKDKIIPVDSKFSLENYNRLSETNDPTEKARLEKIFVNDLKIRITETSKYIRPAEGTMDFAFMFIPHEAIYYDLLINKIGAVTEDTESLIQRAAGKYKVIIVSPTSFLAYLQTVLQGLKAMQIEETTKDIIKRVGEIGTHLKKYEDYHGRLGNSLETVVNHFNNSSKEFKKIDKDVLRITGTGIDFEVMTLDKPAGDE